MPDAPPPPAAPPPGRPTGPPVAVGPQPGPGVPPLDRPRAPRAPVLTPRAVVAVAAAGILAAVAVPGHRLGLGAVVAALVTGAAVTVARRHRHPTGDGSGRDEPTPAEHDDADVASRLDRLAAPSAAGLAGALVLLPVWTDAWWVLLVTSMAALGLAVLATGGGATWRGIATTTVRTVPALGTAARDTVAAGRQATRAAPTGARLVRTTVVTVTVLVVFGGLFASADAVFADLLARYLLPDLSLGPLLRRTVLAVVVLLGAGALVALRPSPGGDRPIGAPRRRLVAGEWWTPLAALVVLFAAFLSVQAGSLFTDHATVVATPGVTYASAARTGFAQLLAIAFLTLVVVAVVGRYAVPRHRTDELLRRWLVGALGVQTLAVLASALHRLVLYEQAYGFTRDRLVAHATILWLAALFAVVLALGALRATRHLPRATVAVTALALLVFGIVRPDAVIAAGNVARFEATGDLDVDLLASLSADAAPALATLPDPVRACVDGARRDAWTGDPVGRLEPDTSWLAWNVARSRAADLAPPTGPARCPAPGG